MQIAPGLSDSPAKKWRTAAKKRTINEWDSQYQLHSKPVGDVRLDPDRIREYNIQPQIRYANRTASLWLGNVQIVGAVAWWDVATGKVKADASAFSLMLTDARASVLACLPGAYRRAGGIRRQRQNHRRAGGAD
jgi:hypothetical protein